MLIAIDVGNSHTVIGIYAGKTLIHRFRLRSDQRRTADEYGVLLRDLMNDAVGEGSLKAKASHAVLASVVPPLTRVFKKLCLTRFGITPVVVGPGTKTGMPILYENARDVGADRVVNAVAGYERFRTEVGGPYGVIIVDFGTATTFDVVTPKGQYLGGAITPGIQIATDALFDHAAKLPRVELALPPSAIGRNTVHSMQSGILLGHAAMVDGIIERMRGELEFTPKVLATGGFGGLIAQAANSIEQVDDMLTLEGLRLIFERQLSYA